jgi:hypothetical protein
VPARSAAERYPDPDAPRGASFGHAAPSYVFDGYRAPNGWSLITVGAGFVAAVTAVPLGVFAEAIPLLAIAVALVAGTRAAARARRHPWRGGWGSIITGGVCTALAILLVVAGLVT